MSKKKGKPGRTSSGSQTEERFLAVLKLKILRVCHADIKAAMFKAHGIRARCVENYIARAEKELREKTGKSIDEMKGEIVGLCEYLIADGAKKLQPNMDVADWKKVADVLIEAQNQIAEIFGLKKPQNESVHHLHSGTVGVSIVEMRRQIFNDPDYIEYQRSRAIAADSQSSPLRTNGQPGALETCPPSGTNGSGGNGHAAGNGRH